VAAITTRVYPNFIPQGATLPLIVYQKVTGTRDHALAGPTGKAHPRFQIEAWGETYTEAKGLANAIRGALDGTRTTSGSVTIGSTVLQSERDFYEAAVPAHRIVLDFSIWHTE
jgi:hypothetical protein